jgi:sphingomyelin phosphodiesterase
MGFTIDSNRFDLIFPPQAILYDLFKRMLGSGPVYAALGNHDTYNQFVLTLICCLYSLTKYRRAQDAPYSIGGTLAQQFSW